MGKKKAYPKGSACKPCWELKYCPYGALVEWSPAPPHNQSLSEIIEIYNECLENFKSGKLQTEADVWSEIDRIIYFSPNQYQYLSQFDSEDIGCKVYGHTCPFFISQSGATETKEPRRQGRYLPREVMLKVVRRDNHVCQVCFKYVPDNEVEFDHIIPYSKGGPTTVDNIRLLCRSCNREKSDSFDEKLEKY